MFNLASQLEKFAKFAGRNSAYCSVIEVGPAIFKVIPKIENKTSMTVGFLALVHGNETLGLPIVNQLLEDLLSGAQVVDYEVYIALGNIPAALADKRFLEIDLNRCFGRAGEFSEFKRARELEIGMLNHCDFVIDLHQTVLPANKPFFIFQYSSARCLQIIKEINPGIPTVLQFDQIGNATGLSTDEYMRKIGKFGTALELGGKGTSEYFNLGLEICRQAMDIFKPLQKYNREKIHGVDFPLFQLLGSFRAESNGSQLHSGWENLKEFKKGQSLGFSQAGEIFAPRDGFMLFPRMKAVNMGQEVFYIATPLELNQLLDSKVPEELAINN